MDGKQILHRVHVKLRPFGLSSLVAISFGYLISCTQTPSVNTARSQAGSATRTVTGGESAGEGYQVSGTLMVDLDEKGPVAARLIGGANVYIEGHPETAVRSDPAGQFMIQVGAIENASLRGSAAQVSRPWLNLLADKTPSGDAADPGNPTSAAASNVDFMKQPFTLVADYVDNGTTYAVRMSNLLLVGGRSLDLGTIKLEETGAISGRVKLSDGASPLGTTVYVPGTSFIAKADEAGSFVILYVPEGSYSLIAEKSAYAYGSRADVVVLSKQVAVAGTITLEAVDGREPNTTIVGGPPTRTGSNLANFDLATDEPGAKFLCRLDNERFSPCYSPVSLTRLGEGSHRFEAVSVDASGNVDPSAASWNWTIDLTAPMFSIRTKPDSAVAVRTATVLLDSPELDTSYTCIFDSKPLTPCVSPIQFEGLADGYHSLQVSATDAVGNSSQPSLVSWQVDTLAVDTLLVLGPQPLTRSSTATVAFISNKTASFFCQLDEMPEMPCGSPTTWSSLPEGAHTMSIRASDTLGQSDASPLIVNWTIDSQAPDTIIAGGPDLRTGSGTALFDLVATESDSDFRCRIDNERFSNCYSSTAFARLREGLHSFEVVSVDAAGNIDDSPATWLWTVDLTAPQITVLSKPSSVVAAGDARISMSSSESETSFSCSLDGRGSEVCTNPVLLSNLSDGYHTLQIIASDSVGNLTQPILITWQIDSTAIDTTAVAMPDALTRSDSATIAFIANKAATFTCKLDSLPSMPCSSPTTWTSLPDGPHELTITATDNAGLLDSSPLLVRWVIDSEAPTTPVFSQSNLVTRNVMPTLTWSDVGAGSLYTLQVDTSPSFNTANLRSFENLLLLEKQLTPALSNGLWYFRIKAQDAIANESEWSLAGTLTIDTVAPTKPILNSMLSPISVRKPSFSWQADNSAVLHRIILARTADFSSPLLDISELNTTAFTPDSDLADGDIYWKVSSSDALGNQSEFSAVDIFTIDTAPADTPRITAVPSLSNNTRPSVSWTAGASSVKFCVQIAALESFSITELENCNVTTKSFTPVINLAEGLHFVRVAAFNNVGVQGQYSLTRSFTIDLTPPAVPKAISYMPYSGNDRTPTLTWLDGGPDASTWDIEITTRMPNSSAVGLELHSGLTNRSFTPPSPLALGPISWRVRARDAAGNLSDFSASSSLELTDQASWKFKFPLQRKTLLGMENQFLGFDIDAAGKPMAVHFPSTLNTFRSRQFYRNEWRALATIEVPSSQAKNIYGMYTNKDYWGRLMSVRGSNGRITIHAFNEGTNQWSNLISANLSCGDCSVVGFADSGASVQIAYFSGFRGGSTALKTIAYLRNSNTWYDGETLAGESERAVVDGLSGSTNYYTAQDFFKKHYEKTSLITRVGNYLAAFYYSKSSSFFVWKDYVEAETSNWTTRRTLSSTESRLFSNAEKFYLDRSYYPNLLNYESGRDKIWNGSTWADRVNTQAKISMSVSNGGNSSLERDSFISYSRGTSSSIHVIEDDDGQVMTQVIAGSGVGLSRYGNPMTAINRLNSGGDLTVEVAPSWRVWMMDRLPQVGSFVAAAFDSQAYPAIAYRDGSLGALKFTTTTDGVNWSSQVVQAGVDSGYYASLAFYEAKPWIAHYQASSKDLMVSYRSSTAWTHVRIDSSADVGSFASLATENSSMAIAYYDESNGDLKLAVFNSLTKGWTLSQIDGANADVGQFASLKIKAGRFHIAYYDRSNRQLKYASNSSGKWMVSVVDSGDDLGQYASLAVKSSGLPAIAYYNATLNNLKYAEFDGSAWNRISLQEEGDIGRYASLAFDNADEPHACAYDQTNSALSYSSRDTNWAHRLIDGDELGSDKGAYCSMVINPANGAPSAAYQDSTEGGVNFVEGMVHY